MGDDDRTRRARRVDQLLRDMLRTLEVGSTPDRLLSALEQDHEKDPQADVPPKPKRGRGSRT